MVSKKDIEIQCSLETKDIGTQTSLDTELQERIKINDIENIIFSGGFMKGYAYIGFLRYIKEQLGNKRFKNIIGVSIGSVFGLALVIESNIEEITEFLFKHKLNKIDSFDIESFLNFNSNYGIDHGIKMNTIIKMFLFQKLKNPYITFKQLYEITKTNFIVVGCNLSLKKTEYFSHKTTPDMMVWLALRISCNLPFFLNSIKYNNNYYLDGGITSNYPIDYIKNHLKENLDKTLILKLKQKPKIYENKSFPEYLSNLLGSLRHQDFNRIHYFENNLLQLNVSIETYEEHITDEKINEVIEQGYIDTKDFFEN